MIKIHLKVEYGPSTHTEFSAEIFGGNAFLVVHSPFDVLFLILRQFSRPAGTKFAKMRLPRLNSVDCVIDRLLGDAHSAEMLHRKKFSLGNVFPIKSGQNLSARFCFNAIHRRNGIE